MNIVEKLLKFDVSKIKNPERKVVLKLPKLNNEEVEFTCFALDAQLYAEIQEEQFEYKFKKKGGEMKIHAYKTKQKKLLNGCPLFKDKELIEHFKVKTPFELMDKILVPGNMDDLAEIIDDLSGYEIDEDEIEEEIENL